MSATPYSQKSMASDMPDARAGAIALVLLRVTLMGCVAALIITLGSVAWKIAGH